MSLYKFNNIGLRAISSTVPHQIVKTRDLTNYNSLEQINKFIEATGVEQRHFADSNICASDLCYNSAIQIFSHTEITPSEIDVLIFVSQTPDYKIPGTSILMQNRLGLKTDTMVFDVNMSCSGFLHGILMAYMFLQSPSINNVMVMVGDTLSKLTSPRDKGTGLLLGDAGTCTIVGKGDSYGESYFSMVTEGSHFESVHIKSGGSRNPTNAESLEYKNYDDGSYRNDEQIVMVGADVFSFAISKLPKDIRRLLDFADMDITEIDNFVFHQANNFMMEYIARKSKADVSKILHSIHKYGNTAGTSIPLCMCENNSQISVGSWILMNAIGAGFAYGTAVINISDCKIFGVSEL